jgi:ribosomal protein L37E
MKYERCPDFAYHHVGEYCATCGLDERRIIGNNVKRNPAWRGYTMGEFLKRWAIHMRMAPTERAQDPTQDWPEGTTHWRCTFQRGHPIGMPHGPFNYTYTIGPEETDEIIRTGPPIERVLFHVRDVAIALEVVSGDFEQWCEKYQYQIEGEGTLCTFFKVVETASGLKGFLGLVAYDELLHEVRRDNRITL